MASFNLTAEINLRGPSNIKKVVGDIKREIGDIQANVSIKLSSAASKNINAITGSVNALNDALIRAQTSASNLSSTISSIGGASNNLSKSLGSISTNVGSITTSADSVSKSINQATSEMAEFGKQSALAVRRFAAFSVGTAAIYGLARAFTGAFDEFVKFDRQIVRLKQTTGGFGQDIDDISKEISRLSTSLGVSSADLIEVSVTLAQAGLSATETKGALEALAKTTLSPSFEDITKTTEGAIAAMRQFGISTNDLEQSLSSINAVAAAFAVESSDIIAAIQRTGGVFASASRGVSEGKDALNEFVAVFTSVRATTRESAETIATGLRTIFTRLQRPKTIEALREFGVELTDAKGKFVGAYEAINRISQGLQGLDTRDIRFAKITEELGGFRQIGKVIPLIQEFSTAQAALNVAIQGQGSLSQNAVQAQEALAVQFAKTREEFLSFVRSLGESGTFKNIINFGLSLTRVLIQVADSFKPILPYLAIMGGLKGASALTEYVGGFVQNIGSSKKNSQAPQSDLLGSIFSGSSKEKRSSDTVVTDRLETLLSENNGALVNVTNALNSLERALLSKLGGGGSVTPETPEKFSRGGVLAFARGGYVPGSGNRDTVPAMLQPGEFVIRKKAVETIGANKLQNMNKYGTGGRTGKFRSGGKIQKFKEGGDVADVDFVEGYDGDSFKVDFTPAASPYRTMSRLVGADTYEVSGKGADVNPQKAQAAAKITTNWAKEASQTNKLTSSFKRANKYDSFGRPMFDAPDLIDTLRSENLLTGRFEEKNLGGLIQKFAIGGKVNRKIGYIDYDVIANEANKGIVDEGMKKAGVKGPRLYADYLTDLAVQARKNSDLQKLRAIYGVAGSGKTTLARGQGTDIGTLRETERFPILSPDDIQKATEVMVMTSSVSRDKLEGFLSEVDRAYTLSSTSPAEQDRIRKQRASRDITGIGLEGRNPGTTSGVSTDTAIGEALLGDALGSRSVVLGRTDSGRLRAKSKDELVEIIKKRIGFTWGGFAPTTRGHESIVDSAAAYGIPPEDFIALVGANESIKAGDPSSYRTAIMDQDARTLLAKAGFGAKGATVLKKPRDFEVPQGFDITQPGGNRRVLLPGAGSTTFVADKEEDQLKKYRTAGYDVATIPRSEGISGTMVRELIAAGDLGRLQEVLSPGVYDMVSKNIGRLQNRANVLPSLIQQAQASQSVSLAEVEKELAATGIKRADRKKAASDPEYAALVEVYDQLRQKRDKIKDAAGFEPYRLLAKLAALEPDKYGLDFSSSPSLGGMGSVSRMQTDVIAKQYGGLIQKFMPGGLVTDDIESSLLERLLPKTSSEDDLESLLGMISKMGGNEKTRNLAGIQSVSIDDKNVQTSDLLNANKLRGYSRTDTTKLKAYLPHVRKVIDKAVEKYNGDLKAKYDLSQMPNNNFGLVGLTPFDFEKTYGPMLIGGKKTTIMAKGLSSQYQDVIAQLSAELSGAVDNFAYNMQMNTIFGGSGALAFDFDETLVKDAAIYDANGKPARNSAYNDPTQALIGLQSAKLTPLGEELKKRLANDPSLLENIRVLTARPSNNVPLVAQTLSRLGLNIPEDKITGVGGWRNKINNIGDMETLIDDKLETIQAFRQAGRPAVAYQPLVENLAGRAVQAGQASMEGAAAEKVLAKLGAQLMPDADPTRPIDYPDGLGIHAAQYWGMDPSLPTEVKRDLNSDAVGRTKDEIGRFYKLYADRYKVGGEVTESELLGKYKQLIASILPPEMISQDGLLRKPGGGGEPITIVPPEDQTKTLREKMFSILLGKPQPKKGGGASYSGGLMYKILRKNLEDAKPDLPETEYNALDRFVKENLLFQGEDDIINLAQQKRPGSFAHESFHDIQGYLLDYFPQVYKQLQSGIETERKSIEAWYSDPSTERWRSNRDYQLKHLYPESTSDSPYRDTILQEAATTSKKITGQTSLSRTFWDKTYDQTMKEFGRAEAIPVLMAASAEGDPLSTSILSRIFGAAGLNPDFYKNMPKFAAGGKVSKEEIMAELKDQANKLGTNIDPLTLESMAEKELVKRSSTKNFGKIGLWNEGNRISASYLKGTGQGVGAVHADSIQASRKLFSVQSSGANQGYGPKLYDVVMEAATANGGMLVSDRLSVSQDAYGVWSKYFSSRPDVSKTPLSPEDWYTGERYFDTKAFGSQDPSTWPPHSDPAWILQTAYGKQPSLIDSDLVQRFAQGGSAQDTVPALLTPGEFVINKQAAQKIGYGKLNKLNKADKLQGFNKGGSVGLIQKFADGGTPKSFTEVEVLAALTEAAKNASISLQDFADFVKVNADLGGKAAKSRGESLLFQRAAAESAATATSVKGTSFDKTFESMFGKFDTYQVGGVLIDAVNKIITNTQAQAAAAAAAGGATPAPTPPQATTPALPSTREKFDLLSKAAGEGLDKLTEKIKQFVADTAIAYKNVISVRQTTTQAAIALAADPASRNEESKKNAADQIKALLEATNKFSPDEIKLAIEQALGKIDQGASVKDIIASNTNLANTINTTVTSQDGLKYSLDEAAKKFGTLTQEMKPNETLLRGIESGRWKGRSTSDIERMQASSEANPFWDKLAGNKFPGFDMLSARAPEAAEKLGMMTEKAGGFISVVGGGLAIFGNSLPKAFKGIDSLTGSTFAASPALQGFAKGLNQAGAEAVGMAKLAQQSGLTVKEQGIATLSTALLAGISGALEGAMNQAAKNNAEAFGSASSNFDRLSEQLKLPGIQPEQNDEIRQQMLESLAAMDKSALTFDDMVSTDFTKYLYDFAGALKDAAITIITTMATLKTAGFSKGGIVSYYSNGDIVGGFKPKGTDTVPAMLTPGEFVVNAKSARKNRGLLEDINSGNYMARGGVVYAAKGDWIKSDKEAGRSSTGYMGTLSDFYNPFDEDFYKSSNDATEAILKFGGRLAMVTAIISGAAAAVIGLGPAIGTFFTTTLPGFFTSAFSMITSGASSAWGTITSFFTGAQATTAGAAATGSGTTLVGAGIPAGSTVATAATAAKSVGFLATIAGYAKNLAYLAGFTGALSFGFSLLQRLGVIGNRDSQGILANTKQLEALRNFSREGLQKKDYTDLKSAITGSKGLAGKERDIYFTKQSPIIEQFQRSQLLNKDFQIGLDQSVGDFISGLDEESKKKAQIVADEAQMEYIKKAMLDAEVKRFEAMGMSTQEAQTKALGTTQSFKGVSTLQQALDKALIDVDFNKLLNKALNITGIEAQSQLLQEIFGRLASKIQSQTDTILLSLKIFTDNIAFGSESLKNLMEIGLPNLIGNRMGGANPQFKMDRQSLSVLGNLSANSDDAINQAVQDIAPKLGLSDTSTKEMQARFRGARTIEVELPAILRKVSEELTRPLAPGEQRRTETDILREGLKDVIDRAVGPDQGNMSELLLQETISALTKDNRQNESGTNKFLTDANALKTALKGVTEITDAMRKAADAAYDLADQQMKLSQESGRYFTQVVQYRSSMARTATESRIALKETKGERVTLQQAFRPLEAEIEKLTRGGITVVQDIENPNRDITVGWQNQPTMDPDIIASRLEDLDKQRREMGPARDQLNARLAVAVQNKNEAAIRDTTAELNQLNQSFALNTSESDSLSLALKKLSEDTSRSSRALKELQDIRATNQSRENNLLNFLSQANNPQAMIETIRKGASLGAVMNSDKVRLDQSSLLRILPDAIEAARLRESSLPAPERQDFRNQFGQSLTLALKNAGIGAALADKVTEGMWGVSKEEKAAEDEYIRVEDERLKALKELLERMERAAGAWSTKVNESGNVWKAAVVDSVKELNTVIQSIKDKQAADAAAEAKRQGEIREIQDAVNVGAAAGGGGGAEGGGGGAGGGGIDANNIIINGNGTIQLKVPLDLNPIPVNGGTKGVDAATRSKGGIIYASNGQYVNFQPKGTDTVPAMLTPGEFVVNKQATQKNLGLLRSINNGASGYSSGGVIYRANGSDGPEGMNNKIHTGPISFYDKVLGAQPSTPAKDIGMGPYRLMYGPRAKYSFGWGPDTIDPDSILGMNMQYEPGFGEDDIVKSYWKNSLKTANQNINDRLRSGISVDGDPLAGYTTEFYDKPTNSLPSVADEKDKAIGYKYLQSKDDLRRYLTPEDRARNERLSAKNSRSWMWTPGRDWLDYFGFPENSEETAAWAYGLTSKILPSIFGIVGAGVGFATGAPLGPGAILTGAAGGYAGTKTGEFLNKFIYESLFPSWLKSDIEQKQERYPQNYAGGQWIGFASELAGGAKYGPVIEQATKGGIRKVLLSYGDEMNAAAYSGFSHEQITLAAKRLKAQTETTINKGQVASEKVTGIHGTPRVSNFEQPGVSMDDVIDPSYSKSPGYGPDMDPVNPGQLGMHGHNLGINSIMDNINYAQKNLQEIIGRVLKGKAGYKELQLAMDDAGFILSDISMGVMDDSIVQMMRRVSQDKPQLFDKIIKNLTDRDEIGILRTLGDGVDRQWFDVLNKFKSSFEKPGVKPDIALAEFRSTLADLGISGTRATAFEIRGGAQAAGSITGESLAVITNKILENSRAVRLADLAKFKTSFIENAQMMGYWINEAGSRTVVEAGTHLANHGKSQPQHRQHGGLIYASNGSLINFQPRGTDTVPAMLTPGEFVVNREATQKNLPLLKSINNGYYKNGGLVKYFQDGGLNAGGQSGGGVLIGIDSSSLDAAFGSFKTTVGTMKKMLDDFGKNVSSIKIGDNFTDIVDASRKLSTAAASIRNASDNFGSNISRLNETLASLENSISSIPSTISLQVSGGIPVNVNVTINDGNGLDETLQPFADTIYTNIAQALSKATDGNVNIQLKTTKGALV